MCGSRRYANPATKIIINQNTCHETIPKTCSVNKRTTTNASVAASALINTLIMPFVQPL